MKKRSETKARYFLPVKTIVVIASILSIIVLITSAFKEEDDANAGIAGYKNDNTDSVESVQAFLQVYKVLMSPRCMLRALLKRKVVYIGSLGPRKKLDRMIEELRDEGISITDEQLSTLYGPVGLDIGAETSEEIALSILAEIKAVFSSATGQSLRTNSDVIHSRSDLQIERVEIHGK